MAEVFDFGLQQHKIKMDGKFFENNLFAVAGDTGRRLEIQLLDSNNMVQNTTGISLRLNANVAGQATYAEAALVDATKGLYKLDLPNGMLIAPGNWQFQWQIIGASGEKLHSFAFMGSIGSNLSEGATEGLNFYLNLEDLKHMQEDFISGAFDSSVLETNIAGKLTDLETQYAPKLTEVATQFSQNKLFKKNSTFLQNVIDKMQNGEEVNIVSIGDSTANSSRADDVFSSPRYHERIQSNLRSFYNRSNINVINKAVGGRPAIAAVRDIEHYDTDPIQPDLWIIMFGINDANPDYAEGQTIEDFKENMSILTERALNKGAEVLLVSPSSIWKPDFDRPKRQKNYARAVKDVASKYQVAYFDLEYNFSKLIIDDIYGIDDLVGSDFVHKTDLGYKIMGDLVSQNILNTDLYVQEGVTIPVRRSPYLSTNSATILNDAKDKYGYHLLLNKAVPNEYLKFNFMVTEPNIDLVLIAPLRSAGGVIKYTVDGIEKTLDFYSPTVAYNAEFVIAKNIAIGYHEINFSSNDITLGQVSSSYDPVVDFSAFQFRKNTNKSDALFNSDNSSFTKYKSAIGAAELSNSTLNDKAVVFGEYVHGGELTFITKGKFVPNTGIMWNAKDNFAGYLLRFHTNLIIVAAVRKDDVLEDKLASFDLKQYSGTVDYTNEITFKIKNKKDGTINVYMNGVLIITLVDTRHKSGRFGIFANNASLNINDLKYSIT